METKVNHEAVVRGIRRRIAALAAALISVVAAPSWAAGEPVFAFTSVEPAAVAVVAKYFRSGDYLNVNAARKVRGLEDRIGHDNLFRLSSNLGDVAEWAEKPCRGEQSAGLIIYDPEEWEATPALEKADRHGSVAKAERIVKQSGCRKLGYAPSRIFLSANKQRCNTRPGDLPKRMEWRSISVLVIQSQGLLVPACQQEGGVETFAAFVSEVTRLARARNPNIVVLAEVSLNRSTPDVSVAAMERTKNIVDGFYIAYPIGADCKYCTPAGLESILSKFRTPVR